MLDTSRLEQWKSLDERPPLSEIEALRLLNTAEFNNSKEKAIIYVILAFHRIKRHPKRDAIADQIIEEARSLHPSHPLVQELYESLQLLRGYTILKSISLEHWILHETDHNSAKLKKVQALYEEVDRVQQQWNEELAGTVDAVSRRLKLYQEVYDHFSQLKELLEDAQSSIEHRRVNVPVKEVNEQTRQLTSDQQELYDKLPALLKEQGGHDPLQSFQDMVGLYDVKAYIQRYYHFLKYQQQRKSYGFSMVDEPGLHMIITGNPGTGKTTIARLLANIYYELGILETKEVVEVNRSHLVGSYVGQSEENTMSYIKQAVGGVLFIDEAYSLRRDGQTGNDYGQAVIDTLVSAMTSKEYGGKFAIILAGYPEEMRQFLWANPGLRSRFPEQNMIQLPDYQMDELLEIAQSVAIENDFFFTDEALRQLEVLIEKERVDDTFGNARTVRNLVLKTIFKKGADETWENEKHWLDHMRIEQRDLEFESEEKRNETAPIQQLNSLIGLQDVKEEVKKLSSFVQAQQQRKEKGLPVVPIQLHSVFSGNPGTGKTTVADIYARILKECGLLKRGHVVVASRSDLVAGYVGQTAIKTRKKIREALGGVLFIDEAYSLRSSGRDDFGKEAIETLVDEMTKHNENLVVILAGYQQEMRQLIESNPGLSSRFKKYMHFPDYTPDELLEMAIFEAERYDYLLVEEAHWALIERFNQYHTRGNGRFVNNLILEAIQYQSMRLLEEESSKVNQITSRDIQKAWENIRGER
ncbi:AAA family ATPase [Halobacillus sp. Marseille-Q1614]|uniref:AAA family ATPase n=1 Tax=Halobacillus sp. Marseille-Q1614 TaxID=2709134 RepID=UPI00156FAFFA|nr:AAA family ATPase [Halobacillus sp. Marseille-Q1614]